MAFVRDSRSRSQLPSFAKCLLVLAGCVAGAVVAPRGARAQSVDSEVQSLVDSASNDYDNLKIPSAKQKLKEAVRIGKTRGASDAVVAEAYVMVGVVEYGASRNKNKALKAFKNAVKLDPSASIPNVYQTPTLTKLMKKAKKTTGAKKKKEKKQVGTGSKKDVDEFTHEPISTAQAGDPLLIEAFVPTDLSVGTVEFVFKRYDEDQWHRVELKATNATRFATKVPGYKVYTSQISYYLEVKDPADEPVTRSGTRESPHSITVLGSAGFDPEKAKKEYMAKKKGQQKQNQKRQTKEPKPTPQKQRRTKREPEAKDQSSKPGTDEGRDKKGRTGPSGYVDFAAGTGLGFLPGNHLNPTANPDRRVNPGVSSAFAHTRLGGGYIFPNGAQLGVYLRFQFLPAQDFAQIRGALQGQPYSGFRSGPCLGTGLPGDCLLGAKYRWFFSDSDPVRFFSSVGAGVGIVRHWLRLKEKVKEDGTGFCGRNNKPTYPSEDPNFDGKICYRADTVRPGWMHFGVGGGLLYKFSDSVGLLTEMYMEVLFPDTAVNLDLNVGPQLRF